MSIRDWFYHRHYWGIPHKREGDNRMIQICYECGKEREVSIDLSSSDRLEESGDRDGALPGERSGEHAFS